jgi:hypothetical protein
VGDSLSDDPRHVDISHCRGGSRHLARSWLLLLLLLLPKVGDVVDAAGSCLVALFLRRKRHKRLYFIVVVLRCGEHDSRHLSELAEPLPNLCGGVVSWNVPREQRCGK